MKVAYMPLYVEGKFVCCRLIFFAVQVALVLEFLVFLFYLYILVIN